MGGHGVLLRCERPPPVFNPGRLSVIDVHLFEGATD